MGWRLWSAVAWTRKGPKRGILFKLYTVKTKTNTLGMFWGRPSKKKKKKKPNQLNWWFTSLYRPALTLTDTQVHVYLNDFSKQHGQLWETYLSFSTSPHPPTQHHTRLRKIADEKNTIPSHVLVLKSFRKRRRYSLCLPWLLTLQTHTPAAT